jgi:hypothetical protein
LAEPGPNRVHYAAQISSLPFLREELTRSARARSEPRAASPFTGDKITGIDLIADPERLRDIDLLVPADHIR